MVLSCHNIGKSFGDNTILSAVSFNLESNDKLAVVGGNGCGKSTLLKIITGEMTADDGTVVISSDIEVGYLAQYQDETISGNILDIVLKARPEILSMQSKLRDLEALMGQASHEALNSILDEYTLLNDRFSRLGGNTYESEASGILKGLGFSSDDLDKSILELSGGQKTRVFLAKLLLKKPDILILDEPINHLDIDAIVWLEDYLAAYSKAAILVAHDRYFLDKIVGKVLDISKPSLTHLYTGNYSEFYIQKQERLLTQLNAYNKQQKEIEHQKAVIEKLQSYNREKSIKRAESRKKILDKMDVLDAPVNENTRLNIAFSAKKQSGNDVLKVEDLAKSYGENKLFSGISFELHRGDRMAILGSNGIGKTTILKIINRVIPFDEGKISFGTNVQIGYYDQEQQQLDDSKTVIDELWDRYPSLTETKIRNVLAAFGFREDEVYKSVSMLSGGERGRLALSKLMLSEANLLILDEPTNHLDMDSKETLEQAVLDYNGTLLFVSHDRYFINRIADHIMEMTPQGAFIYDGNYDEYLDKKSVYQEKGLGIGVVGNSDAQGIEKPASAKNDWEIQKAKARDEEKIRRKISEIENEIDKAEVYKADLENRLLDPSIASNSAKLGEIAEEIQKTDSKLEELMLQWEELM